MGRGDKQIRSASLRSAPEVAVVTGAGSGIGRELALACAREGMAVLAADTEVEALAQTLALVDATGAASHPVNQAGAARL